MNKWLKLILGLVVLAGVALFTWYSSYWGSFWNFRHAAWEFLKGGLAWLIALIGLVIIILGINDIRS